MSDPIHLQLNFATTHKMDHLYSLLAPLIFQGDTAVQSDQDVQRMIAEVGSTMKPKFDCIPSFKDAAEYGKWLETFNLFKQIVEGHSFLLLRRDQNLRISADATFAKHDLEAERLVLSDKFASIAPNTIKPWGLDSLLSSRAKSRLVPPFELKLIEPLQPGAESKLTHHVWRAETRGEGGPLSVVIKIFDPIRQSFAETYNQVERKWQKNDTIWRSAREQFLRENWGYSILEDLQGGLLPHSYGFYKVGSPKLGNNAMVPRADTFFEQVDLPYASGVACHVMEDLGAFSGGQEYLASPPKQRKSHQRSKPWVCVDSRHLHLLSIEPGLLGHEYAEVCRYATL